MTNEGQTLVIPMASVQSTGERYGDQSCNSGVEEGYVPEMLPSSLVLPKRGKFSYRNCDPDNTNLNFEIDCSRVTTFNKEHWNSREHLLKSLLVTIFSKLASQLHLSVDTTSIKPADIASDAPITLRASVGSRTRQVLFGSTLVEVSHHISVHPNPHTGHSNISAELQWYHPSLERSVWSRQGGAKSFHKRTRFIQLFNASWVKILRSRGLTPDSDCEPIFVKLDERVEGSTKRQRDTMESPSLAKCGKRYSDESTCSVDSSVSVNNSFKKLTLSSEPNNASVPARVRRKSLSSVYRTKELQRRSSLRGPETSRRVCSVRFAASDMAQILEVPMSKDERQARVGFGESASLPCGAMKPLRSPVTGMPVQEFHDSNVHVEDSNNSSVAVEDSPIPVEGDASSPPGDNSTQM